MRASPVTQGTLLNGLNGEEVRNGGDVCVHMADSLCCTTEINATL